MHDTAGPGYVCLHDELFDFGLIVESECASELFQPAVPTDFPRPPYAGSHHHTRFFQIHYRGVYLHVVLPPVQCEEIKVGSDGVDALEGKFRGIVDAIVLEDDGFRGAEVGEEGLGCFPRCDVCEEAFGCELERSCCDHGVRWGKRLCIRSAYMAGLYTASTSGTGMKCSA